jgi:drug/metabolite transporter superfamily protein YnfA
LLVVAAVVILTLETIPESRFFIAAALMVGGAFGFFLWLRHR